MLLILAAAAVLLSGLAAAFAFAALQASRRPVAVHPELFGRLAALETELSRVPGLLREEVRGLRTELGETFGRQDGVQDTRFRNLSGLLDQRLSGFGQSQADQVKALREETAAGQARFDEALKRETAAFAHAQTTRLAETNKGMEALAERLERAHAEARSAQRLGLEGVAEQLKAMMASNADGQVGLRDALNASLDKLRAENTGKLDEMRATVDEKLQSTLDARLEHSFKQVREGLESVNKNIGEMQTLATGVGDLKRVLTNVKSRGTWGEVQLGALLEDVLNPDQYVAQARVRPRSAETVDYAVRFPGQDERGEVLLPIDCKFPQEDFERLIAAQEAGDAAAAELAGRGLERAIRTQAKSISEKYIHPPATTNFAYMYLPTEGLFAEVVRRPGFVQELRSAHRVEIAGPSTLFAVLNSFRVGLQSLQIQKKSSEVWTELGRVKTAFEKYGDALEAVDGLLDKAKTKVADAGKRHRDIAHRLRNVDAHDLIDVRAEVVALPPPDEAA